MLRIEIDSFISNETDVLHRPDTRIRFDSIPKLNSGVRCALYIKKKKMKKNWYNRAIRDESIVFSERSNLGPPSRNRFVSALSRATMSIIMGYRFKGTAKARRTSFIKLARRRCIIIHEAFCLEKKILDPVTGMAFSTFSISAMRKRKRQEPDARLSERARIINRHWLLAKKIFGEGRWISNDED